MAFLKIQGLTKNYGSFVAVHDVALTVERGEFVSLLGPSGCGKSTTLQMIAGFIEPTAGTIVLEDRELSPVPPNKRGLGIVFQSYALFPHMTAAQNVSFGLEMQGVPKPERHERISKMLQLVGLAKYAGRYPKQLSGGQQQRVAVARALVTQPKLLLLDEPLSNLDAKLREGMQEELRQIQQTLGTTTILVTHDQAEALALSDRVVVMNEGRVEQVGTPIEVYNRPSTDFAAQFLGKINTISQGGGGTGAIVNVRPEQISFADTGLAGRIQSRVFVGYAWLFRVDTGLGEVLVMRQNDGAPMPNSGDQVHLSWHAQPSRDIETRPTGKSQAENIASSLRK